MDLVLYFVAVSGSIKPGHVRLITKPSHLTLRIASCITLNYTNRFFPRVTGIEIGQHVPVPDGLERLGAGRNTLRHELPDFLDQTGLEHPADAPVNPIIELLTLRIKPHNVNPEPCNWRARPFIQVLRKRLSGFQANLQSPDNLRLVPLADS